MNRGSGIYSCLSDNRYVEVFYDENYLYIKLSLKKRSFWKRVSYAIKYIFGKADNFDVVLIDKTQIESIDDIIHKFYYDKKHIMLDVKPRVNDKNQFLVDAI